MASGIAVSDDDLRAAHATLAAARHPLAWVPPMPLGYRTIAAGDLEAGLALYAGALAVLSPGWLRPRAAA